MARNTPYPHMGDIIEIASIGGRNKQHLVGTIVQVIAPEKGRPWGFGNLHVRVLCGEYWQVGHRFILQNYHAWHRVQALRLKGRMMNATSD